MSPVSTYLFLTLAITAEVVATTALSQVDNFTRLWPTVIAIVGYTIAFFFLSFTLRVMPTGIVYAIWSGMGIVFVALIAWVWFGQKLDLPAILGLGLIVAGVVIVNLFSKSLTH